MRSPLGDQLGMVSIHGPSVNRRIFDVLFMGPWHIHIYIHSKNDHNLCQTYMIFVVGPLQIYAINLAIS
jgi:hypothetical protein